MKNVVMAGENTIANSGASAGVKFGPESRTRFGANYGASTRLAFALEDLCREILNANGWRVEPSHSVLDNGLDIIAVEPLGNERIAFEIKYTRNITYPTGALRISVERLIESASAAGIKKAILIVAANTKPAIKEKIESEYGVQILNLDELLTLASVDLEFLGKLVKLCEVDLSERSIDGDLTRIIKPVKFSPKFETSSAQENQVLGNALIASLQAIPHGKDGWSDFEAVMSSILKYLFDGDLTGWYEQRRTTDSLHRYDLICRVIDKSTVWKFISLNLDSRYVLFEFKNYKNKLEQSQIYSTEKYLYEKAKRKVSFIVSRMGASKNALVACQGAMREHGKLILNLDQNMIIELINSKILGNDPNVLLFDAVDNFLMELPR